MESQGYREQGQVDFDMHRHSEKKGEMIPRQTPEGKEGEMNILPFEGIVQSQKQGAELAKKIEEAPDGAVYMGFTSNVARTQEADYIFSEEIRYVARKHPEWKVVHLKDTNLVEISQTVAGTNQKVVVMNSGAHEAMGMHPYDMDEIVKDLTEGGLTEVEALKQWLDDPETQRRYKIPPEHVVETFRAFVREQRETMKRLFPGRPAIISGVGHSWELDIMIASSLGKELTGKTIDDMGGMINTMEGAEIEISPEGKVVTRYRNLEAKTELGESEE